MLLIFSLLLLDDPLTVNVTPWTFPNTPTTIQSNTSGMLILNNKVCINKVSITRKTAQFFTLYRLNILFLLLF